MDKNRLPILNDVCNLSSADFEARLETLRRDLLPHVTKSESRPGYQSFEFESAMRSRLEDLVVFEQQCCPDLHWSLDETDTAGRFRLVIRGLPEIGTDRAG